MTDITLGRWSQTLAVSSSVSGWCPFFPGIGNIWQPAISLSPEPAGRISLVSVPWLESKAVIFRWWDGCQLHVVIISCYFHVLHVCRDLKGGGPIQILMGFNFPADLRGIGIDMYWQWLRLQWIPCHLSLSLFLAQNPENPRGPYSRYLRACGHWRGLGVLHLASAHSFWISGVAHSDHRFADVGGGAWEQHPSCWTRAACEVTCCFLEERVYQWEFAEQKAHRKLWPQPCMAVWNLSDIELDMLQGCLAISRLFQVPCMTCTSRLDRLKCHSPTETKIALLTEGTVWPRVGSPILHAAGGKRRGLKCSELRRIAICVWSWFLSVLVFCSLLTEARRWHEGWHRSWGAVFAKARHCQGHPANANDLDGKSFPACRVG